jgi:hypothetical protein
MAQKLLELLVERQDAFVPALRKEGILNQLFADFSPQSSRLTPHLMRIIERLIESKQLSAE